MTENTLSRLFAQAEYYLSYGKPLEALDLLDSIKAPPPAAYRLPQGVSSRSRLSHVRQPKLTPDEFLELQALRFRAYDMLYSTATDKAERERVYTLAREAIQYVMTHHRGRYQRLHTRYQEIYEPKTKPLKSGKARARQQRREWQRAKRQSTRSRRISTVLALVMVVMIVIALTMLVLRGAIISPSAEPTALLVSVMVTTTLSAPPTLTPSLEVTATERLTTVAPTLATGNEPSPSLASITLSPGQTQIAMAGDVLIRPGETFNPTRVRFYRLPVRVYASALNTEWDAALTSALAQVRQAIRITRVLSPAQADVVVEVVSEASYAVQDCPLTDEALGCGWIIAVRQDSSSTRVDAYDYRGFVRIIETAPNPPGLMLHELLHALGLHHSDTRGDIMFPFFGRQTTISDRDLALLLALYRQ